MRKTDIRNTLLEIYRLLYGHFGPRHWWPGDTRLEIIIGAILTQNTAWTNVERAIANLKRNKLLNVKRLSHVSEKDLAELIKPSGYYNIKSRRIKFFLAFLNTFYEGSINKLFKKRLDILREELINVKGIGQESADSILLYAGKKPVFVIDAYTKRIFSRHGYIQKEAGYEEAQNFFIKNLPPDVRLFNEYHALIVELGKTFCKSKKPLCEKCPIRRKKK